MKAIGALIAMCLLAFAPDPTAAQTAFPARTVRILVGYVPGGPNDIIARAIGDKLAQLWDKSVIVENVPGASGNIAGDRVAKAPPDGYTLLLANSAQIVVNPSLFEKMNYDPLKELAPVSEVAFTPNLLTVPNDLPVHNVQELIALVRARPENTALAPPALAPRSTSPVSFSSGARSLTSSISPIAVRAR